MKRTDIPELLHHLRSALAKTTGMSVALSGSLARGDFRTRTDGTITSDLDLIPVVPSPADVAAARAQLQPVLQSTADQFGITATAAITLQDRCLSVPRAWRPPHRGAEDHRRRPRPAVAHPAHHLLPRQSHPR
ncbi:hypothetical protein ACGFX2_39510 [Streptomyces goshikiensis]|uniref:hypothetical protein n=1 Tax=Streptomyces goshikiensis TaxID=1942 RepID=UPI0037104381